MKVNVDRAIIKFIFLFPIGTILSNIPLLGGIVNKFLYFFLILLLILALIRRPMLKTDVTALALLFVTFIYDCILTGTTIYNSNELFYLVTWVIYLIYVRSNYDLFKFYLCEELDYVKYSIVLWELIVGISFIFPISWSDGGAFYSFSGGQHRMDSATIMIFAAILILYRYHNYRKKVLLFAIIPTIAVALSGARTYLIIVGVILAIIYYYSNIKHVHRFWVTIIPLIVVGVIIIMSTSVMQERMAEMAVERAFFDSQGYNALTGITSGRSTFWIIDLQQYWKSSFINKIFGNGFNFVRYVNETYYTTAIWAHNDFINIICCNGIVGIFLYFYAYLKMVSRVKPYYMDRKVIIFMTIAFHICCMFNAMFNMLYSYFAAAVAVPVLLFAMMDDTILPERKMTRSELDERDNG
ncbi:MAG: O-antigen ligase family protein [Eubacteriales bacterium]|nr:O-antigen ligase family protein [Eubacteriales bacterium]